MHRVGKHQTSPGRVMRRILRALFACVILLSLSCVKSGGTGFKPIISQLECHRSVCRNIGDGLEWRRRGRIYRDGFQYVAERRISADVLRNISQTSLKYIEFLAIQKLIVYNKSWITLRIIFIDSPIAPNSCWRQEETAPCWRDVSTIHEIRDFNVWHRGIFWIERVNSVRIKDEFSRQSWFLPLLK
jgi:hypothetical protein